MTIRRYLAGASAVALIAFGPAAFAQQGTTSGPAAGGPVKPNTAVEKQNPMAREQLPGEKAGAVAVGAPGTPAQPGTEGGPKPSPGMQAAGPANQPAGLVTAQKLTQDLQNAGFSNVKVVEEAFVVSATTKEGNPIVMTLGPNGMSAFEAITGGPASTGSTERAPGTTMPQR